MADDPGELAIHCHRVLLHVIFELLVAFPASFMHSRWKAGAPVGASQHIAAQQIRTITFSQKLAVNFAVTMRFGVNNASKTTQRIGSKIPRGASFCPIKIRWSISFSVVSLMLSTKAKCLLTHAHMQIKSSRALEQ